MLWTNPASSFCTFQAVLYLRVILLLLSPVYMTWNVFCRQKGRDNKIIILIDGGHVTQGMKESTNTRQLRRALSA